MPTTTIAGTRYDMALLTGRDARAVGLIVTSAALRALAVAMSKADLATIVKQLQGPDGQVSGASLKNLVDTLSWPDISKNLAAVGDGFATLLETIDADGLETLSACFTAKTTAYVKSDHPGSTEVYPTPLANRDDYWTGKWTQYLQWLAWGVRINGFLGDWDQLVARSQPATGTAGAPVPEKST